MIRLTVARQALTAVSHSPRPAARVVSRRPLTKTFARPLSLTVPRANRDEDDAQKGNMEERAKRDEAEAAKKDPMLKATTKAPEGAAGEQEGRFARTDESVKIEYPDDEHMPRSPVVQGRGGMHFKRTLAQFSLENRVSLVTGGARGLGLVMAQSLIASGSDLAIVDLNSMSVPGWVGHLLCHLLTTTEEEAEDQAEKLVEQFRKENPGIEQMPVVTAHYADVANPDSVNEAIAEIVQQHGKIDNLVTSAGFTENFDAISYPHDRMQKLWGVVVDGTYLFATGVARHLMERQAPGNMVLIGSMSGAIVNVPQPQAPYNAAKAAVRHMASSLAVEWAGHDIRVNTISPGYMLTAL
jgi:NAD(P)-dependent dehydrogenase (short-subunit alcohol dehydrogenase family)